jgi:hypothetical protein
LRISLPSDPVASRERFATSRGQPHGNREGPTFLSVSIRRRESRRSSLRRWGAFSPICRIRQGRLISPLLSSCSASGPLPDERLAKIRSGGRCRRSATSINESGSFPIKSRGISFPVLLCDLQLQRRSWDCAPCALREFRLKRLRTPKLDSIPATQSFDDFVNYRVDDVLYVPLSSLCPAEIKVRVLRSDAAYQLGFYHYPDLDQRLSNCLDVRQAALSTAWTGDAGSGVASRECSGHTSGRSPSQQ